MRPRRSNVDLRPAADAAWSRLMEAEQAKDLRLPLNPDHVVLFGGPTRLVELAAKLANDRDPPPDRLLCHPDDYRAAGAWCHCPVTFLALMPRLNMTTLFATFDPSAALELPRKCALEPDPRCPRGEVWVADCLLGRIA